MGSLSAVRPSYLDKQEQEQRQREAAGAPKSTVTEDKLAELRARFLSRKKLSGPNGPGTGTGGSGGAVGWSAAP